jgi:hypothetical protein
LPGDGGYFLHAQFLKFQHPVSGEQINLEAGLPDGFSGQWTVDSGQGSGVRDQGSEIRGQGTYVGVTLSPVPKG